MEIYAGKDLEENINGEDNKVCPFVGAFYKECYITDLNNSTIEGAILRCGNNYRECRVYKKLKSSDDIFQKRLKSSL